jgi:hypothetical protein
VRAPDQRRAPGRHDPRRISGPPLALAYIGALEGTVVLLAGLALGALVLLPSLGLLFRLVLRGRFDAEAPAASAGSSAPGAMPRSRRSAVAAPDAVGAAGALVLVIASASWLQVLAALAILAAAALALPVLVLREGAR